MPKKTAKPTPIPATNKPTKQMKGTPSTNGSSRSEINKIAPNLKHLIVDIDSLIPDPDNARLHPEDNMEAIKASLTKYGQVIPLVVRKETRHIIAGNGRWAAAKALGWTRIAANLLDISQIDAIGLGLADNRTAELAEWNTEVVLRLNQLLSESGQICVGWSSDQITALRQSLIVEAPEEFPAIGEDIDIEHICPKCGYAFSGGEVRPIRGE